MDDIERFRAHEAAWPKIAIPVVLVALVCAAAAYHFYGRRPPAAAPAPAVATEPAAPTPTAPATPQIAHPIETPATGAIESDADIHAALDQAFGAEAVGRYLEPGDFAHRSVATLDNLGRGFAPSMLWPVKPVPGKFEVDQTPSGTVIGAANARRYAPFVHWLGSLDAAKVVDLYVRMYPALQHQYETLGYPHAYLNDRLVSVIDQLLETPDVKGPIPVQLVSVEGPIRDERPWTRYQYADPSLEALSSGQKILLRMGPENEAILKTKLRELKSELAKHEPARG